MIRALALVLGLALPLASACDNGTKQPDPTAGASAGSSETRTLVVPSDHPQYGRFEAPSAVNACAGDGQCVKGGCNDEVCAAESVVGVCDVPAATLPKSAACGCVAGQCAWYSTDGAVMSLTTPTPTPTPATERCGDQQCAAGETCIEYYGIAGPRGPKFQTCGIPCKRGDKGDSCPEGKRCTTIADGPGDVCQ
jgi:hypothetical protein